MNIPAKKISVNIEFIEPHDQGPWNVFESGADHLNVNSIVSHGCHGCPMRNIFEL